MYSAHTHEVTTGALIADEDGVTRTDPDLPLSGKDISRLARGATIVVETNRDMYVGRLDLKMGGDKVVNFNWAAIPVDESVVVAEGDPMAALVASIEKDFLADENGNVMRHTFMPGAFCNPGCGAPGERGHQLVDDLDTVADLGLQAECLGAAERRHAQHLPGGEGGRVLGHDLGEDRRHVHLAQPDETGHLPV